MTIPAPVKPIVDPHLLDLLRSAKNEIFRSLRVAAVGRIERFDAAKKTAEVHLLFKRVMPDGSVSSYPPILDCPVVTVQGGGAYLQMPVTAGDQCLVIFSDRNLDAWFKNGSEAAPLDARCHDLSDAIALVGLDAGNSAQPSYPTDEARLAAGAAKVAVKKDGSAASIKHGEAEVSAVNAKVRVKNASTDLLTALQGLIDAIKAAQVVDPISGMLSLSPATVTALDAQKTILQGLLST